MLSIVIVFLLESNKFLLILLLFLLFPHFPSLIYHPFFYYIAQPPPHFSFIPPYPILLSLTFFLSPFNGTTHP